MYVVSKNGYNLTLWFWHLYWERPNLWIWLRILCSHKIHKIFDQGYHIFFGNIYMSVKVVNDLFILNTSSCWRVTENHVSEISWKKGKLGQRKRIEWKWDGFLKIPVYCYSESIAKLKPCFLQSTKPIIMLKY